MQGIAAASVANCKVLVWLITRVSSQPALWTVLHSFSFFYDNSHYLLLCRINGLTHINLTKLDCLDALDTIKLGVEYQLNGKALSSLPADLTKLEAVEVIYEDIPGWNTDISKCRSWDELPANAKTYIARIEELIGVKCKWIGVGPGRDAIVVQP